MAVARSGLQAPVESWWTVCYAVRYRVQLRVYVTTALIVFSRHLGGSSACFTLEEETHRVLGLSHVLRAH